MKLNYKVTETITIGLGFQQALLMDSLNKKMKKSSKKEGFVYAISAKGSRVIVDILCDKKFAMNEEKNFNKSKNKIGSKLGKLEFEMKEIIS